MKEIKISPNEAGQRLDKFLHKYLKEAGSSFLYKMLRKKNITLNGAKAEGSEKLEEGDMVKLFLSDDTIDKFRGQTKCPDLQQAASGVNVIYENAHILAVNKPAGLLTQKADADDYSLNEWLLSYLLTKGQFTKQELHTFRPSAMNRLDRNTSGLVLCGKSLKGSQELSRILKDRSLHKFYRLFVSGRFDRTGITESYLLKDHKTNQVKILDHPVSDSRGQLLTDQIKTGYRPVTFYEDCTCLEVELFTGKTHQIRAQLAALGHPLLGDTKYGSPSVNSRYRGLGISSQLLHAYRVVFPAMDGELKDLNHKELLAPEPAVFDILRKNCLRKFPVRKEIQ